MSGVGLGRGRGRGRGMLRDDPKPGDVSIKSQ